jgi:hypothetical protein
VLAAEFVARDVGHMWSVLESSQTRLAALGAHHVVQYTSVEESNRVLVTVGVRNMGPVQRVIRSPLVFEWFDAAGVDHIPPLFAGTVIEKVAVSGDADSMPPSIVVSALICVDDIQALRRRTHQERKRLAASGVLKIWMYRAFDDAHEVLVMMEVENARTAQDWISLISVSDPWTWSAAGGIYPAPFVGMLNHIMGIVTEA